MPYSKEILNGEWKQEWLDMPEFSQEVLTPYRTLYIHFRNAEDVKQFAQLIGQKITPRRKFLWYPESPPISTADLRYVDEP